MISLRVAYVYSDLQREKRVAKANHVFRGPRGSFSSLKKYRHLDLTVTFREDILDPTTLKFQAKENEGSEQ